MRWLRESIVRLFGAVRTQRSDEDLAEELRLHAELAAEAGRDARVKAGGSFAAMEALRDQRGLPWLDDVVRDVRHAVRSMRRSPAFTTAALVTLALGIGATAAIFTVVHGVLLRPLPFPEADRLFVISYASPGPAWLYPGMSDRGYVDYRDAARTFESTAMFSQAESTLTGAGAATRLSGAAVTVDFFRVLGVSAAIGRTFGAEDEAPGRNTVLISDSLWQRQFGSDPRIVDSTITLNGLPYRVIGILPRGFSYPADAAYWIPQAIHPRPGIGFVRPVIGRAKPGITRDQAQADLEAWARNLPSNPNRRPDLVAQVTSLHDAMVRDIRLPLLVFGGAVSLVLLIGCANVANLLLMRAISRRYEIATRLALGASRARLVRQFLAEGAVLSLAGGALGAATAFLVGPALLSLVPAGRIPADVVIRVDGWVLAFTAGLSLLTGLIVGIAPIAQASRRSLSGRLRPTAGRRSHRLRDALVVAEVALTLVLVVSAGLLVRSFIALSRVPLGFTPGRVMTMTVDLPVSRYPDVARTVRLQSDLLASLKTLPGVESAAAVNWLPLGDLFISGDVHAEGRADLSRGYTATKVAISSEYFATIGIGLLRGRAFASGDRASGPPVAIVSESVARRLWPDTDPVGKRIALVERPEPKDWLTVVGVVEDVRQDPFSLERAHAVYQPYEQVTNRAWAGYMTFLVRTHGNPAPIAPMMREALARIDPDEAPQAMATLDTVIGRTVAEPRFLARILAFFALTALLLAAIGIYGVLASAVLERRTEIGVRMALGADRASVMRTIGLHLITLTCVGLAIGVAGALASTGVLESLLFGVTPMDLTTFGTAGAVLIAAAIAAAIVPVRRAARLDPATVLRAE